MTGPLSDSALRAGAVVADTYVVTRLIGRGGMGAVWEAEHRRLPGKRVAIKILHAEVAQDAEALARFRREAEIASRLAHPNIVEVHDFNTLPDGSPYLVLELLEGESLERRLWRGPMRPAEVYAIVRQVAAALQAAHQQGVVHRDLKPQNVFLVDTEIGGEHAEVAKVLDFGISKIRGGTTVQTHNATMLGTPQYMAPEQATSNHAAVDERTDVFSLGAMIYEMLSGKPPFRGQTIPEVVFQVVYGEPAPLAELVPELPADEAAAVHKALSKAREERFASVAELALALTGQPLSPPRPRGASSAPPPQAALAATVDSGKRDAGLAHSETVDSARLAAGIATSETVDSGKLAAGIATSETVDSGKLAGGIATSETVDSAKLTDRDDWDTSETIDSTKLTGREAAPAGGSGRSESDPAGPPRRSKGGWIAAALVVAVAGGAAVAMALGGDGDDATAAVTSPRSAQLAASPEPAPPDELGPEETAEDERDLPAAAAQDAGVPPKNDDRSAPPHRTDDRSKPPHRTDDRSKPPRRPPERDPDDESTLPETVRADLAEARRLLRDGSDYREVVRLAERALRDRGGRLPAAHVLRAKAYCRMQNLSGAKEAYRSTPRRLRRNIKRYCARHDFPLLD